MSGLQPNNQNNSAQSEKQTHEYLKNISDQLEVLEDLLTQINESLDGIGYKAYKRNQLMSGKSEEEIK